MDSDPDSLLEYIFLFPALVLPPPEVILGFLSVALLLICSGLISGSEVAFFSLTPHDFEKLAQENKPNSQRILKLKDKPRKLLATILISNNFINIAIVILSDFILKRALPEEWFRRWSDRLIQVFSMEGTVSSLVMSNVISFLITVVAVTFLLVLLGEIAPKVYGKIHNVNFAKTMSGPMLFLMQTFSLLTNALVSLTNIMEKRLAKTAKRSRLTSREDIDEAIELTVSSEQDTGQEVDILKSIVKFGDVSVKQVMTSRVDAVAVDFRISYEELLKVVRESGYSRIPVYDSDFDNITGILYVKDLLGHLHEAATFEWQQLIRTNILYVPEAKKISDLLKEFQRKHLHMAIVVDEYGGSSGIVTLEDILEEVIGEIKDEFDDEAEVVFRKIDDFNFLFEGKTLLNDVCRILGLDTNTFDEVKGDSDSLAGLILELCGQIPKKDAEVNYNEFKFKIVSVSKRRIEQVLITLPKT